MDIIDTLNVLFIYILLAVSVRLTDLLDTFWIFISQQYFSYKGKVPYLQKCQTELLVFVFVRFNYQIMNNYQVNDWLDKGWLN